MVNIKCEWCGKASQYYIGVTKKGERTSLQCHHCNRPIPSSIKHLTGNLVGSKHYHEEYEKNK